MALTIQRTLLLLLLAAFASPLQATSNLEQQRKDFLEARKAVKQGALTRYRKLIKKLDDYPLRGYLEYEFLKRRLSKQSVERVHKFFVDNADSPIHDRLRGKWLRTLVKQGRWTQYVNDYQDLNSPKLACYYARALQKIGHKDAANKTIEYLWLSGKSQPRACDAVFNSWRASGQASPEIIWQRIRLAMHKRRPNLARYLAKFLGPTERSWVERWYKMYRRPAKMLNHQDFRKDTPLIREIVLHGVERLARIDATEAAKRWHGIRTRYSFTADDIGKVERRIGLSAATQGLSEALLLLTRVDASWSDETVQQWRVRSALAAGNWNAVLHSVDALPESIRDDSGWQYWRARALDELGYKKHANEILSVLATRHHYHGQLAADRLGLPYSLDGTPLVVSEQDIQLLRTIPGIKRAEELFDLKLTLDARREWQRSIDVLNPRQLEIAAALASSWGWHDRAVLTIGRTGSLDDLKLRFPIVYEKQVTRHAKENHIEPAWVFGVLRQESAYMTDARSHAGAMGLMQLMPRTARMEARKLRLPLRGRYALLNVDKNIRLGTAHLKRVLDINKGHHVLATASYNAGVQRVRSWLPKSGNIPADIWIETLPFNETRNYIKKVIATTAIFEKHLGQPITPIGKRLAEIKPRS